MHTINLPAFPTISQDGLLAIERTHFHSIKTSTNYRAASLGERIAWRAEIRLTLDGLRRGRPILVRSAVTLCYVARRTRFSAEDKQAVNSWLKQVREPVQKAWDEIENAVAYAEQELAMKQWAKAA